MSASGKLPADVDLRQIIQLGGLVIDGGSDVAFAPVHLHHRSGLAAGGRYR